MKVCTKCGESKPLTDYYKNAAAGDGLTHRCKTCMYTKKPKRQDRTCSTCKTIKPLGDFYGTDRHCKPCRKERDKGRTRNRSKQADAAHSHSRRGARGTAATYRFVDFLRKPECGACQKTDDLTYDHITPVKHGGTSDWWNFQILCRSCNSKKGAKEIFYASTGKVVDSIGFTY